MSSLISILILALSVAGNLTFGLLVLRKNPRHASHFLFSILNATLLVWSLAMFFSIQISDPHVAIWFIRSILFVVVLHQVILFLFSFTFPLSSIHLSRGLKFALSLIVVFGSALALSPFVYSAVTFENGQQVTIPGPGMIIYMPLTLVMPLASMALLYRKLKKAEGILKMQLPFILFGFVIMLLLQINLNFFAPVFFNNTSFIQYGPLFVLVFQAFVAYAILRHRLLNIRAVIRKSLIYGVSVVFAVLIYGGAISYLESVLQPPSVLSFVIGPLVLLLGFEVIKKYVRGFLDRYIFTEVIDLSYRLDLETRFDKVHGELEEWFAELLDELRKDLSFKAVNLFLVDKMHGDMIRVFPQRDFRCDENPEVMRVLSSLESPVFLSALLKEKTLTSSARGLLRRLQKEGDIIIPLAYYGRLHGFLLVKLDTESVGMKKIPKLDDYFDYKLNDIITYFEALRSWNLSS